MRILIREKVKNLDGLFLILILSVLSFNTSALNNEKRALEIVKVNESPKIDCLLNESVWQNAAVAKDFFQYYPYNGNEPSFCRVR